MPITHTIEIGKKRSKSKKTNWGKHSPEEIKEYYNKKALDFVKEILDKAKDGKRMPWESPNFIRLAKNLKTSNGIQKYNEAHPDAPKSELLSYYRGVNMLRLCMAMDRKGFTDSRFATETQIKELGGSIKPEERGNSTEIMVYKPIGSKYTKWNPQTKQEEIVYKRDRKTKQFILDEKGQKIPQLITRPFVKTYQVYNATQIEGITLAPEKGLRELKENEKCPEMETIIANSEAKVYMDQGTGFKRYYSPALDEIHVPPVEQFKSQTSFYSTVAHEIGHSTGHPSRLKRDMCASFGEESYAREEMVAELTSVFLSQQLNIKIPQKEEQNHETYLQGWSSKIKYLEEKPMELYKIVADAQKATDYIRIHMLEKNMHKDKTIENAKDKSNEIPVNDKEEKLVASKVETKRKGIHRKSSTKGLER